MAAVFLLAPNFKLPRIKSWCRNKRYRQLTQEDRYHIYVLRQEGYSLNDIAVRIGVHKSTISREIKRNSGGKGYRPIQAQNRADKRRKNASKFTKMTPQLKKEINIHLQEGWSPEQIAGRFKRERKKAVSHEKIYQYIKEDKNNGGVLFKNLRHSKKKYKKRFAQDRRGKIQNKNSIENRPAIVNERKRIGDFERDLVIGKNHKKGLLTIVDRVSKLTLMSLVNNKTSCEVGNATISLLRPLKAFTCTLTNDCGKEFSDHERVAKELGVPIYFCHPYSSYERGTNENTNGLIRQYFPKDYNFNSISEKKVTEVLEKLNNRPRKCLNFATPYEVFCGSVKLSKTVAVVT